MFKIRFEVSKREAISNLEKCCKYNAISIYTELINDYESWLGGEKIFANFFRIASISKKIDFSIRTIKKISPGHAQDHPSMRVTMGAKKPYVHPLPPSSFFK